MALTGRKSLVQRRALRLLTAPVVEPITLVEVKTLLRDPPDSDDTFLTSCLEQARIIFEAQTGICCINQSWRLHFDHWPGGQAEPWWGGCQVGPIDMIRGNVNNEIMFERFPLVSVDALSTFAEDGTETSRTVGDFFHIDTDSLPGRVVKKSAKSWPSFTRVSNGIRFDYTAGFGASADDVPEDVKRAIQHLAAWLYDNRGESCSSPEMMRKSGAQNIAAAWIGIKI